MREKEMVFGSTEPECRLINECCLFFSFNHPARRKMLAKKQFSLDSRLDLVEYCLGINNPTAVLPTCTEFNITQEVSPTDCQENGEEFRLELEKFLRLFNVSPNA